MPTYDLKTFANILTECSSCHQGKRQLKLASILLKYQQSRILVVVYRNGKFIQSCVSFRLIKQRKLNCTSILGLPKSFLVPVNVTSHAVAFIRSGIFQCWNIPDEVTYRSVMVSPGGHKPTQLLQFLAEWVGTNPVPTSRKVRTLGQHRMSCQDIISRFE